MTDNAKLESITEDLEGIIEDHDADEETVEDDYATDYMERLAEAVARQR